MLYKEIDAIKKIEKILSNNCPDLISRFIKTSAVDTLILCGSYADLTHRKKSDLDLICVYDDKKWDAGQVQVAHYKFRNLFLDVILYPRNKFIQRSRINKRLLSVLLNPSEIIFSKSEKTLLAFNQYKRQKYLVQSSKIEIESIWYNFIWSLKKIGSYEKNNPLLSEILATELYYFIGLFYSRLFDKEIFSYIKSLKFMEKNDDSFWELYSKTSTKKSRKYLLNLLKRLPGFDEQIKKKSFVELDNYISPHTVIDPFQKVSEKFKQKIDKIILL